MSKNIFKTTKIIKESRLSPFLVCFLGASFVLYQFLIQGSTSLMVPELMHSLCLNLTEIGFLSSAFFYPYILLQIPSGYLIDKFGARTILLISTLLLSLASLAFSMCDCYSSANITRFLMGAASAPGVACAMSLAARWYPKKFTIVAAMIEMMGMVGGAIGDYALSYSTVHYGWRESMLLCSISGAILCILIYLLVYNQPSNSINKQSSKEKVNKSSLGRILMSLKIWKSCIYGGAMFSIISAFASLWSIPFLTSIYQDATAHTISKATSLVFIGASIGTLLSAYLANRLSIKLIQIIFSILATISFAIILFYPLSLLKMMILLFFLGVFSGSYILPFSSVEKQVPIHAKGIAMGFTNMIIIGLGGPILQPLIGWIINHIQEKDQILTCQLMQNMGTYQVALLPILMCLIIAIFLSILKNGFK